MLSAMSDAALAPAASDVDMDGNDLLRQCSNTKQPGAKVTILDAMHASAHVEV